jgi:transposase-like protein
MSKPLSCPFCFSLAPRITITSTSSGETGNLVAYRCEACGKSWNEVASAGRVSPVSPARANPTD